jgi:hypothetical protein
VSLVVSLPTHLWRLAGLPGPTLTLEVEKATLGGVLDALEERHPELRGTIRDHPGPDGSPGALRPFIRFFALDSDLTPEGLAVALPDQVTEGREKLRIIGAIAGG